jgi:Tfp pilus assembly protein FimT
MAFLAILAFREMRDAAEERRVRSEDGRLVCRLSRELGKLEAVRNRSVDLRGLRGTARKSHCQIGSEGA